MSTLKKAIFKECLLESTLREIREIEVMDYQIRADEDFKRKILGVIDEANQKIRSRKITLSLIAAIIVCFSIIVSVSAKIRTAVVNFFVEIHDTFTEFFIEDEDNSKDTAPIETIYEPTYFKDNGYERTSQSKNDIKVFTVWNKDENAIIFSQYAIYNNGITLDTEDSSYEIAYVDEQKVYYSVKNDTYFVKWLGHGYSFNIKCDASLEWTEIEKIISSLQPVVDETN